MSVLPAGVLLRQYPFTSVHVDTYTLLSDVTPTSSWQQPCLIIQLHLLLWRWRKSPKALWPWHSVWKRLRQNRIHVKATTDVLLFKVSVLQHNSWIENHCYNSLSSLRDPYLAASAIYFWRIFLRIFHKNQSVFSLHSICSVFTWLTFETVSHNRWRWCFFFFLSLDLCIDIWKLYWDWDAHGRWKL